MLVLLSPAKSQDFETPVKSKSTQPKMKQEIQTLVDELKNHKQAQLAKLMSLSDKLATLNFDRYQQFSDTFTKANSKQAVYAFQGDAYKGLNVDDFDADDLAFLQQHLLILSGLYGALRPLDLIQPYRLEMKTSLKNPIGKDLYAFWDDKIAKAINQSGADVVINLASNEYFKAIDKKALKLPVITCHFKEKKGDDYKVIGIHAKRARGLMTRFITKHRIEKISDLKKFKLEGYQFNKALSSGSDFVFTREN